MYIRNLLNKNFIFKPYLDISSVKLSVLSVQTDNLPDSYGPH